MEQTKRKKHYLLLQSYINELSSTILKLLDTKDGSGKMNVGIAAIITHKVVVWEIGNPIITSS